jgi:hypothetical protein
MPLASQHAGHLKWAPSGLVGDSSGNVSRGTKGSIIIEMPGPTSSNDLVLEMMREVISERQRDLGDGISPRSLNRRFEDHAEHDEKRHDEHEARIRKLEEQATRSEAHTETGRYILPAIPINYSDGAPKSKRPSISPLLKAATKSPAFTWGLMALMFAASTLLGRCGIVVPPPPVPPPPASHAAP